MKQNLDWELVEKYYGKYTFFYNGPCSNWYPASFSEVINDTTPINELVGILTKQKRIKLVPKEIQFNCSEQYMMFYKAITFKDYESAEKILIAEYPGDQKALGRDVKNFNFDVWSGVARKIVYDGCYLKFTQNQDLREELLKTKGTLLVEASPTDTIWGIGMGGYEKEINDVKTWKGANWLGEVLTVLRDSLEQDLHDNPYD